jgi:hypothetical protein
MFTLDTTIAPQLSNKRVRFLFRPGKNRQTESTEHLCSSALVVIAPFVSSICRIVCLDHGYSLGASRVVAGTSWAATSRSGSARLPNVDFWWDAGAGTLLKGIINRGVIGRFARAREQNSFSQPAGQRRTRAA